MIVSRSIGQGFTLILMLATVGCSADPVNERSIYNLSNKVDESSGIVSSRTYPGILWTHEDNGLSNNLYAVDGQGDFIFKASVSGAMNVDWEDIAIDGEGYLYVADSGNNKNKRKDLLVYKIREPNPQDPASVATVAKRIRFRYPSQKDFPDPSDLNYDAEALFFDDGKLYLLTKNRSDTTTDLYRFPTLQATDEIELEKISTFELGYDVLNDGGKVTAADISPDGKTLAMLCYDAVYLFDKPTQGDDWFAGDHRQVMLDQAVTKQAEGLAFHDGHLVLTNEEGEIHHMWGVLDGLTSYP